MSDTWQNDANILVVFNWGEVGSGNSQGVGVSPLLTGGQLRIFCELESRPDLYFSLGTEEWLPVPWEGDYYNFSQQTAGTYYLSFDEATPVAQVTVTISIVGESGLPSVQGLAARILDGSTLAFIVKQKKNEDGYLIIDYHRESHNAIVGITNEGSTARFGQQLGTDVSPVIITSGVPVHPGENVWRALLGQPERIKCSESGGGEVILIDVEEGG
jgi:hypothetical protein